MSNPRPPKTPWLTPYLTVSDAAQSIAFYESAFGFTCTNKVEQEGQILHVEMSANDELIVMFSPEGAFGSSTKAPRSLGVEAPQSFYVFVSDVDLSHQRAVAAGARSIMEPADQFWGHRYCLVEDLDGYRWGFARDLHPPMN